MSDDPYDSVLGAVYSRYMGRPRLGRAIARLVWGGDTRPYYESMAAIDAVREGGTVVDCPCGAGPALRALAPKRRVRYVGVDLSPAMLRRARREASARGVDRAVELFHASATDVPLESASADLFLSYWGLHCYDDPQAAVAEIGRVLAPGGRLVGSCFVRGRDTLRQRLLVRPHVGDFGPIPTHEMVAATLPAAGLELTVFERHGPMLYFEATRV